MKPHLHAASSARKFGGVASDYMAIHEFMDSSKAHIADHRHRALLHSTFGCFLVERVFGTVAKNSNGSEYSPRDVAEQHCLEDLGTIPTVQDWLADMPLAEWMGGQTKAGDKSPASKSALTTYKKAKQTAAEKLKEAAAQVQDDLDEVFSESPFNSVTWTQYTPGFNDGDPCLFGVRGVLVSKEDVLAYDWGVDGHDGWEDAAKYEDKPWASYYLGEKRGEKTLEKALKKVEKTLDEVESLLQAYYGDGKRILWVRGKGWHVEDYECGY